MDELEIWKEIPGFDGCFASNIGNIKTLDRTIEYKVGDRVIKRFVPGKIINKRLMSRGYLAVFLHKDGIRQTFLVHRLVAAAFLGEQSDLTVNHKDGNKLNNHISNLEWLTLEDNQKHYNEYLKPLKASERNKNSKSVTKIEEIKVYGKEKEFAVLKEVVEDRADEKTILKYSKPQIKIKKQKGNKRFRTVLKDIYGFDCECLTITSKQMDFYSFKEISDYLKIHTNTLLSLLKKGGSVNGLKIGIKIKH
jgi:hypothetical protein